MGDDLGRHRGVPNPLEVPIGWWTLVSTVTMVASAIAVIFFGEWTLGAVLGVALFALSMGGFAVTSWLISKAMPEAGNVNASASLPERIGTSRRTVVVGWLLSAGVLALGCLPLSLASDDDYPWAFAIGLTACFWSFAVWNVSTLPRNSGTPTGRWLLSLSVLNLITGLVGVWSSQIVLGALVGLMGCAGLISFAGASRRPRPSSAGD